MEVVITCVRPALGACDGAALGCGVGPALGACDGDALTYQKMKNDLSGFAVSTDATVAFASPSTCGMVDTRSAFPPGAPPPNGTGRLRLLLASSGRLRID